MEIEKLIGLLGEIEEDDSAQPMEWLNGGSDVHWIVEEAANQAELILVTNTGYPPEEAVTRLAEAGYKVTAGEKDSFGWLSGVIHTKKGKIVFG